MLKHKGVFGSIAILAFGLVGATTLYGCGGGNSSSTPAESQGTVTGQLSKQAVYLGQSNDTPLAIDANSVTLSGYRRNIQAGTVLVCSKGTGFVRTVTSVATSGNSTVCQTTDAGLPDAFTELHAKVQPQFDQATIGNITSDMPGLSFQWVNRSAGKGTVASGSAGKTLQLDFNKLGISGHGSGSFSVSGSIDFQASPEFDLDIDTAPGDLLPSVNAFNSSVSCSMTGTLTVSASGSGTISGDHTWFDKPVGPPIVVGWLVFVNHLKVESDLEGQASGDITHTQTVNASAAAGVSYARNAGWNSTGTITPVLTATETGVDAEFGLQLIPVKVTLKCELYGLVGPFGVIDASVNGKGVKQLGTDPATGNQVEGIQADVTGGVEGSVGVNVEFADALAKLLRLKPGSLTPPTKDFGIVSASLFSQFFPFTGPAEIVIQDNGDASDAEDVFVVSLDGGSLGTTAKGSAGSFEVNNLSPGSHTISVTYTDQGADGEIGDPPASLEIDLNNGLTFADGSTTVSQSNLPFDVAQTFTIVVPAKGKAASRSVKIRRVHTGRATRTRKISR